MGGHRGWGPGWVAFGTGCPSVAFVVTGAGVAVREARGRGGRYRACRCQADVRSAVATGISILALGLPLRRDHALSQPRERVEHVTTSTTGARGLGFVVEGGALRANESRDGVRRPHEPRDRALSATAAKTVQWGIYRLMAAGSLTSLALMILVLYIIQDRLVYWPSKVNKGSPKRFGLDYEDVNLRTVDGVEISGWFIKHPERVSHAPTFIYFHGTDKNASFRLRKATELFRSTECNILLVSYRGYGQSTGRPSEKGVCIDAAAGMQYLRSRGDIDQDNLWVYGESLGGAVAIWFADTYESELRGLIVENTFTSLLDMVKYVHPVLDPLKHLSTNKWPSMDRIRHLQLPILFLSGQDDGFVPPVMMQQLHQAATDSAHTKFVLFPGGTHNNTWRIEGFFDHVAAFVGDCGKPSAGTPTARGAVKSLRS